MVSKEEKVVHEGLWKLVEEQHRVHSVSKIAIAIKLEVRLQLQNIRQGGFKNTIFYKQWYMNELEAYHDQQNPVKAPVDQAMDFFHSLDYGFYTNFHVNYLNGL